MITSQLIFPIKIASLKAPVGLLGSEFDLEIEKILSEISLDRRLIIGDNILSTIRMMPDILSLESSKNFNNWLKTVIPSLWQEIGYQPSDLAVERSWINQLSQGSKLIPHAHGSTEMVMTYYHKIPLGSSSITFFNPFENSTGFAPFKEKTLTIEPTERLLIAWPGFLWHEVNENKVDDARIAISMHVHQSSFTLVDRWRTIN